MYVMKCYINFNNWMLFFKYREIYLWVYKSCNDENICYEVEEYGSDGIELWFYVFFY